MKHICSASKQNIFLREYRKDSHRTQQLLTYEMPNWSYKTCLDIAIICRNCKFLSHPCAQRVQLSDIWLGGLCTRRYTNWKILFLLIFPFFIPLLLFRIPCFPHFFLNSNQRKKLSGFEFSISQIFIAEQKITSATEN